MLKIAIIGTGIMGSLHARILAQLNNVKLVAICDINKSQANRLAKIYNTKLYLDYKHLLKKETLDAVCIAVPTTCHKEVALSCTEKGINLLVEKPLAPSVADARAIINFAKERKIILTVGHIERFNPAVVKLKELIQKGVFGEIVSIVVKRVGLYDPKIRDVNVVTELAVHDLDIICSLLGKFPKILFANGGSGINTNQLDYADILLGFNRTSCYIQVNRMTPIKIRTLSITGTLGYGELNYITQELTLYKPSSSIPFPRTFKKFVSDLGKTEKVHIKIEKNEPLKLELQNFVESISKKQQPLVTEQQGLLAVKLSEMVLESLVSKKLIKFKEN